MAREKESSESVQEAEPAIAGEGFNVGALVGVN